ncbi:MAG TPA: hypothetical protein VMD92_14420 [Acidobacteriaceae bacterium]|jgi:hypothetical protein|nr:hypothetical protein [Acidobacteriaceae bacterium]
MQPKKLGQVLGIGARLAAKTIRERAAQTGSAVAVSPANPAAAERGMQPAAAAAPETPRGPAPNTRSSTIAANPDTGGFVRRLARGAGRFFATLLRPFAHAGHLLWLEITGVFFGLFALFFLSHGWQTVHAAGWRDRHAEVYCGLGLLFAWFTLSSFWRARRKQRR